MQLVISTGISGFISDKSFIFYMRTLLVECRTCGGVWTVLKEFQQFFVYSSTTHSDDKFYHIFKREFTISSKIGFWIGNIQPGIFCHRRNHIP